MKVAISSTGNTLQSALDNRFGRCSFFAIYDKANNTTTFIQNPGKEANSGAGPIATRSIAEQGVKTIVSGEFGFKVKSLLNDLGIQMVCASEQMQTVADVIKLLTTNN